MQSLSLPSLRSLGAVGNYNTSEKNTAATLVVTLRIGASIGDAKHLFGWIRRERVKI
jgi:hypothetical protein